jgi:hypothetical protein
MSWTNGHSPARTTRLLVRPFKEEFGDIFDRLKRRTEVVDLTAMATQLLRAAESRQGIGVNPVVILTLTNRQTRGAEVPMPTLARPSKSQRFSSTSSPVQVARDL